MFHSNGRQNRWIMILKLNEEYQKVYNAKLRYNYNSKNSKKTLEEFIKFVVLNNVKNKSD